MRTGPTDVDEVVVVVKGRRKKIHSLISKQRNIGQEPWSSGYGRRLVIRRL